MFSLIWACTNSWVNNGDASDLRRHGPHNDVTVMLQHYVESLLKYTDRPMFSCWLLIAWHQISTRASAITMQTRLCLWCHIIYSTQHIHKRFFKGVLEVDNFWFIRCWRIRFLAGITLIQGQQREKRDHASALHCLFSKNDRRRHCLGDQGTPYITGHWPPLHFDGWYFG